MGMREILSALILLLFAVWLVFIEDRVTKLEKRLEREDDNDGEK